jgi:hypothetical protein
MKTLLKVAGYRKSTAQGAVAGALAGMALGELKHRRNLRQGIDSSRKKNLAYGAAIGAGVGGASGAGLQNLHDRKNEVKGAYGWAQHLNNEDPHHMSEMKGDSLDSLNDTKQRRWLSSLLGRAKTEGKQVHRSPSGDLRVFKHGRNYVVEVHSSSLDEGGRTAPIVVAGGKGQLKNLPNVLKQHAEFSGHGISDEMVERVKKVLNV